MNCHVQRKVCLYGSALAIGNTWGYNGAGINTGPLYMWRRCRLYKWGRVPEGANMQHRNSKPRVAVMRLGGALGGTA